MLPSRYDLPQAILDELERVVPQEIVDVLERSIGHELHQTEIDELERLRPRTRGDCYDGPRPCPWVSCRHHLFLDVTQSGSLKLNHPGLDVDQMRESCTLDIANRGGLTLPETAREMGITFERVRQIETQALAAIRARIAKRR